MLATVVKGYQKAPFSIATTLRCREGRYSFPWIAPITLFLFPINSNFYLSQLKDRDEKLGEAGELQRFLGNLDHFQQWLSRTQTTVASEDIPNSLADAEKLLNQHQLLKDEIDAYAPEYAKMKEFGDKVTDGQDDPQYMFLRQVN